MGAVQSGKKVDRRLSGPSPTKTTVRTSRSRSVSSVFSRTRTSTGNPRYRGSVISLHSPNRRESAVYTPRGNTRKQVETSLCPEVVFIEYVIDRSGSMLESGRVPLQQTINLINEQRDVAKLFGTEIYLSITSFNHKAITHLDCKKLETLPTVGERHVWKWLIPFGRTRLIDTAIERLEAQNKAVNSYISQRVLFIQERRARRRLQPISSEALAFERAHLEKALERKVVRQFVLITDGVDTDSKNVADNLKKRLCASRQKFGTIGIFLAANQDALKSGEVQLNSNPSPIDLTPPQLRVNGPRTKT
ncbi:hypothetical protein AAMO2058_000410300 [Amorphochlora amoebiformis]